MLKIYLVSVFPVQPLSFSFSTSAFQFQHLCLSVLALSLFCFSPSAHLLSSFFLFQRFSPFCSVFQRLPFLLFVFWFSASFFSFQFTCCPFFSPKTFFSAQNISLFSPKPFQFSLKHFFSAQHHVEPKAQNVFAWIAQRVAPFSSTSLFFCACLLFSFLPTSKAKNILSRCFTSLLFE